MKLHRLAHRYAKAIFDLSVEQHIESTIGDDMMLIADTIDKNKALARALKSPIISFKKKKNILYAVFGGKVNDLSLKFMTVVAKKGRESFLAYFAAAYTQIYKTYKGVIDAWVTTAKPLEAEVHQRLISYLERAADKQVILHQSVNEELVGGFVLRMHDYQYDASIRNMILRLRKELKAEH